MKKLLFICLMIMPVALVSQTLTGTVYENSGAALRPLEGANVYWKGTTQGTTTNESGRYKIKKVGEGDQYLIFSFIGYKTDTVRIPASQIEKNVVLKSTVELSQVEVSDRMSAEYISKIDPIKTEVITTSGLQRLACCNLSESFENSATVDVSYSDAVAGVKQIQMLGLAGIYAQIMSENMPLIKGLSYPFGLTYVPGPWLESVQVSKGTASVINGYESITGQINVEFKKPGKSEKFFLNMYENSEGKTEINSWFSHRFNDTISTMTLINAGYQPLVNDHNHDGFIDIPIGVQANILHRWEYEIPGKICNQYVVRASFDDRTGGQTSFKPGDDFLLSPAYGVGIKNKIVEISAKHGFFLKRPQTSIGIQTSATYQDFDVNMGHHAYYATEKSFYGNVIYQTFIGNTENIINTGGSFNYDQYHQIFNFSTLPEVTEIVPGAFAQYTRHFDGRFVFIAGLRADYHNTHGLMITPRIHIKSDFSENFVLRLSAGKGYRSPLAIAENFGLMSSSRIWIIANNLDIEEAWNGGINAQYDFKFLGLKSSFTVDFYRTEFQNQIIADIESDPYYVKVSNLSGKSYSNSVQANLLQTIIKGLDYTIAIRYNEVMQTYEGKTIQRAFISPWKFLFSPTYTTKFEKWSFDGTFLWNSGGRIPSTLGKPAEYQLEKEFPAYIMAHFQVTRRFKNWDIYGGVENLTNTIQHNPLIAADNPFGNDFDASLIWGPITGRMYYAGFRYKINYKH
ncbi:MAG: TonB-dependent receptor [Bacteroidetes bacterium HGW-Bacteroidetes-21]|nr:MAG: TonB-dependent receptor [Bacteroidetes bacterium HGW-Bacteroidetes-21]